MKSNFLILTFLLLTIWACSKDDKDTNEQTKQRDSYISATVNGVFFESDSLIVEVNLIDDVAKGIFIYGVDTIAKQGIVVYIDPYSGKKDYNGIENNSFHRIAYADVTIDKTYEHSYEYTKGYSLVSVISDDEIGIEGTFSFDAYCRELAFPEPEKYCDDLDKVIVTNGKFRINY